MARSKVTQTTTQHVPEEQSVSGPRRPSKFMFVSRRTTWQLVSAPSPTASLESALEDARTASLDEAGLQAERSTATEAGIA